MKPTKDAIELWCKEVEKTRCIPMSQEQASLFMQIYMNADKIDSDKELLELVESKKGGTLSAFWLRVKYCHTYKMSLSLALFINEAIICGNFGKSTMMANYLQYVCHKYHIHEMTIKEFSTDVFPFGFPSEMRWQELWEKQKTDERSEYGDNILDNENCGETIRNI